MFECVELYKSKYNESWSIMYFLDRIGGVMDSVLAPSVVDRRVDTFLCIFATMRIIFRGSLCITFICLGNKRF